VKAKMARAAEGKEGEDVDWGRNGTWF